MSRSYPRLVVEADGGSRGNPGVAGYGALVRDPGAGRLLAERAEPLGRASNNVAEYRGVIAGIEAANAIDPAADLTVRMDSKLVVEQLSGRWKIKHEDMKTLAAQARSLLGERTGSVRFEWIPRAQNKAADKLSNDGMDGRTIVRDHWRDGSDDRPDEAEQPDAGDPPATSSTAPAADAPPARRAPVRVLLVRHGVTDLTTQWRIDGRGGADPRLSDEGLDQADRAAGAVASFVSAPVRVVTSQLRRAMQTGAAIADRLGVTPVADPAWDEQDFGDWDGRSLADLRAQHPDELTALRNDRHWSGHGGESHEQVLVRVRAALADLLVGAQPGETIVIVSHRRPMMAVVELVLGVDLPHAWQLAAAPASLTGLEFPAGGPPTRGLVSFANDTHHLRHPSALSGGRSE